MSTGSTSTQNGHAGSTTQLLQAMSPSWTELPDVAFLGKAGAGKTTAAEFLVEHHGYTRLSFAALLKDISVQIWGEDARTDRDKLQKLGVAVREIDPDAWVGALGRSLDRGGPIVVDDCRFPNEYWMLKVDGFVFIEVCANEALRVDRLQRNGKLQDISQLTHVSETALDLTLKQQVQSLYYLPNVGPELDFESSIQTILEMVECLS